MIQTVHQRANDIANIIADYRKGELDYKLDADHVERWIRQFNPDARQTILNETFYVLSKWYFGSAQIAEFLLSICDHLHKMGLQQSDITFWNGQAQGKSQPRLLDKLADLVPEQKLNIDTKFRKHIIYVDDGLYTGSKLRKEIAEIANNAPCYVESIDVFVLVAYSNGLSYSRKLLHDIGREKEIAIQINRLKEISNEKQTLYTNGYEEYISNLGVLWPSKHLSSEPLIKEFEEKLSEKGRFSLRYKTHRIYTSQIFSSMKHQEIVEREFLLSGLNILPRTSIDKGLYPLGYDITSSFGFGSFCATEFNISNTCPVVLWWDVSDAWYPLLPRRVTDDSNCFV